MNGTGIDPPENIKLHTDQIAPQHPSQPKNWDSSVSWPPPPIRQAQQPVTIAHDRYLSPVRQASWVYFLLALQAALTMIADAWLAKLPPMPWTYGTVPLALPLDLLAPLGFAALLIWTYRVSGNLRAFGAKELGTTPAMAVWCHFIPFINVYKPFKVYAEIARASDPSTSGIDQAARRLAKIPLVVYVWCLAYCIEMSFEWTVAFSGTMRSQGFTTSSTSYSLSIIGYCENLALAFVVMTITRYQEEKAKILGVERG